jgi:cell wall assembly regulator SMI1
MKNADQPHVPNVALQTRSSLMNTIDQLWRRIEASLRLQTPPTGPHLAPGTSKQAIEQLEGVLGGLLPEDFRASYRRHNGGFTMHLVTPMECLPIERIAQTWQLLEELLHDEWAGQPPYYFTEEVVRSGWQTGPIQPVWWHRRWIPFGSDSAGNLACLDLTPAAGGTRGQILDWDHECGPSRVLFPTFQLLLAALADQMESSIDNQAD